VDSRAEDRCGRDLSNPSALSRDSRCSTGVLATASSTPVCQFSTAHSQVSWISSPARMPNSPESCQSPFDTRACVSSRSGRASAPPRSHSIRVALPPAQERPRSVQGPRTDPTERELLSRESRDTTVLLLHLRERVKRWKTEQKKKKGKGSGT